MSTPYEIVLSRIQAAAQRNATTLDLSRLRLTALPPSIRSFVPPFVDG